MYSLKVDDYLCASAGDVDPDPHSFESKDPDPRL